MKNILKAYMRASRSLFRADIFWHLVWPGVLAIAIWCLVFYFFWSDITLWVANFIQSWPVIGRFFQPDSVAQWTLNAFIHLLLILVMVVLIFFTSSILISSLALSFMVERIAATDYVGMAQHRGGTSAGSVLNSMIAVALFATMLLVTLPLWLIPGVGFLLCVVLSAWMNQRTYRYDALMLHANQEELKSTPERHSTGMYMVGVVACLLAFVPIFNLLVPALTALAFVHYSLDALGRDRAASAATAPPVPALDSIPEDDNIPLES